MTAYEAKQIAYNSVEGKTKIVFDDVMRCIKEAAEHSEMSIFYRMDVIANERTAYNNVIDLLQGLGYGVRDSSLSDSITITWYHAQPDKIT